MLEIGSLVDGKYKILNEVGHGGMSIVYLAMNEKANKQWAIKEVRKDGVKDFEVVKQSLVAETDMLKKLNHPYLPDIVDVIEDDDRFLIVMDYIQGNSLSKAIEEYGALPQDDVIHWAKQLCDVLGYLHSQNPPIIYRDMKPANIMLKPDGNITLIDFGTAREFKEKNLADTTCLGTMGYAAPEQFGGMGQTDGRTDIYCLGATLYHLVTGKNPCEPPYEIRPIREINPSLSGGLERIILKCTQPNPANRYQNAAELMYALEHYDEIDDIYRKKQKRKLAAFITTSVITVILGATSIWGYVSAENKKSENYDNILKTADTYEDYYNAIITDPIYLKVTGASEWTKKDDIKVTVTDSTGKEVDQKFVKTEVVEAQTDSGNTNPDNKNPDNTDSGNTDLGNNNPGNTDTGKDDAAGKDTENIGSESGSDNSNEPVGQADEQQDAKPVALNSIKIDVTGLVKDSKYSVDISSDGYLFWKKECTAVEASNSAAYTKVAMVKDTYTEFDFTTVFKGWKLDTKPKLAVKGADNNSVKYASSDQETAAVNETTGVVNIKKAGKVSFTATLSVGDSYKTITQSDVAIAKLDQTLSFTDAKTEVYVGDEVAAAASSSASDAEGKITYSVVTGEDYITQDADFTNNGKWTAKSYNNSADGVEVTIKAAIAEDDRYNSAEKTYTTTIKPYAYDDFRKYCEVVGTSNTASDGKIWYSEVTKIKAKDGYKIKDSDGSFVEEIAIDVNNITQGENQFALVIGQEKKNSENETVSYINEGTVSGAYNYDSVKPTLSIAKDNDADWINKDVKITASPSDAGSKIAAVKYTVTDEKDKPLLEEKTVNPNADGSYLITLQASKFANKEIKINVTAYDNAGLRSDTQTQIIKFDTALPNAELSLNSNEGKYYFTDKISVGISATDNFSGIAGIKAVYLTDDVTSASGWDIKNIDWDAENVQNLKADAKSVTISFTDTPNAGNVYVKVTDKAGNEKITSLSDDKKFHFDHTAPTVGIAYSSADENTTNDNYSQLKDGVEYYNHDRYAQITVTDASFNKNATQIKVAVDNKKAVNILDNKAEVQGAAIVKTDDEIWTDNKDGSYTAKLKFTGNHLYKIEASSTDLAGNKTQESTVADSKSKEFYIDELAPVGKVQFSTDKTDAGIIGNWWENILNPFTAISIFKQNQLNIVGSVTDKETGNSGIWTVSYYVNKLDTDTVLSEPKLNNLSADKWKEIKINKSDDGYSFCESLDKSYNKYIVYIKIVDNSGNVKYISTEGAIIDNEAPKITDVNIVDSDNQENKR